LVSQRVLPDLPSLRRRHLFEVLWRSFTLACDRFGGRLIHFSVQSNHLHLLVEAEDQRGLARFMSGLKIRIARAVNKRLGRTGKVFSDRYHARAIRNPTQARNSLAYVLGNDLRHSGRRAGAFDLFSSAPLFEGWAEGRVCWPRPLVGAPPCVPARSWALTKGWQLAGPISLTNVPGPPH
jgi:REP element-mobilizing transposase RayT